MGVPAAKKKISTEHLRDYDRQLGTSYSNARSQLLRELLFRQLTREGPLLCLRCGNVILSADDMSIDHIKPWRNIDPELFWDHENIAYSHKPCNVKYKRPPGKNPRGTRVLPPGQAWCARCDAFRPVADFATHASNRHGLQYTCKRHYVSKSQGIRKRSRTFVPAPDPLVME